MDNDIPRFTPVELEKMVLSLSDRLAVVEDKLDLPMSYVDKVMARDIARRREEARIADDRRLAAFRAAEAEAEQVGHRGPLDAFTRRLNAGEFEPRRTNGGG
jgi:hypothetical protein